MIKRWLRRRLALDVPEDEPDPDEEDRDRGSVVRKGRLVSLRRHVSANREAFQRWYADPEIAELLRHDLEPLSLAQSRSYFDTFILPASAKGICFAIHERKTKRLIGTTALTDREPRRNGDSALFRIVIGEKDCWGRGYGTQATRLVAEEAFESLGLAEIRLEVFNHNERAIAAYRNVGFEVTGEHVEWVVRKKTELRVIEMRLTPEAFADFDDGDRSSQPDEERRAARRAERVAARASRRQERAAGRQAGSGDGVERRGEDEVEAKPDGD